MAVPPDFVAGQVLTAAQMNKIGLWLVKSQTIGSGVSSVQVTDAFSADYEHYRVIISGGAGSTTSTINMTLGATATGYYSYFMYGTWGATTVFGSNSSNGTSFITVGAMSAQTITTDVEIRSPFSAQETVIDFRTVQTSTASNGFYATGGGFLNNTTSYTDFTLTPITGTMTGGTIYVYGYRD
jgi:hypothetical protein